MTPAWPRMSQQATSPLQRYTEMHMTLPIDLFEMCKIYTLYGHTFHIPKGGKRRTERGEISKAVQTEGQKETVMIHCLWLQTELCNSPSNKKQSGGGRREGERATYKHKLTWLYYKSKNYLIKAELSRLLPICYTHIWQSVYQLLKNRHSDRNQPRDCNIWRQPKL